MEIKTSQSYQKEVLEKYKSDKGGELRGYLAAPTRSQIRDACVYLFHRRNEKNDEYILNRFFQFKNDNNKLREIENFGEGKFRSIEKFLKGEIKKTSTKNINLISWLIDFQPRPYEEYLKSDNQKSTEIGSKEKTKDRIIPISDKDTKVIKGPSFWIKVSISVVFGIILMIFGIRTWSSDFQNNNSANNKCMTWADSLYVGVLCHTGPFSKYGTKVEPLRQTEFQNMRRVEVHAAYDFFNRKHEPLIWYYKKNDNDIEYFTAPGLHPVTGKTLKAITPYIIQKYVPKHSYKRESFIE